MCAGRESKPDTFKPTETKQHPYGIKTKSFYCQKCWDVGLKRRKHEEYKCDYKFRRESLERQKAKKLKPKRFKRQTRQLNLTRITAKDHRPAHRSIVTNENM